MCDLKMTFANQADEAYEELCWENQECLDKCEKCQENQQLPLVMAESAGHNNQRLSKSEKKKLRHLRMIEYRKFKRKDEKIRRKERLKDERKEGDESDVKMSKKEEINLIRARLVEGMKTGQRICVDLSMETMMSAKEKSKLAQQLCRLYGANRKLDTPAHVYFAGLNKDGELYKECVRKNSGFQDYLVEMTDRTVTDLFPLDEIVYLTPDGDTELSDVDDSKVYVLGGLVDESISKNTTKKRAESVCISTAKLPISQYMEKVDQASYSQVLAINQVFEILMTFKSSGDWRKALATGVPKRKGYYVPEPGV